MSRLSPGAPSWPLSRFRQRVRTSVVSCCILALSFAACQDAARLLSPKTEEEPWKRNVLAARIQLPATGQPATAELSRLLKRAETMQGVAEVAAVDILPGVAGPSPYGIQHEGIPTGELKDNLPRFVSPGYFRVMSLPLLQGRDFSATDSEAGVPVAIVDKSYATRIWPGQSPLGRRMRLHNDDPWTTVVGIVQDGPGAQGKPEIYIPLTQCALHGQDVQTRPWFVLARAAGDPKAVAPVLSRAVGKEFQDLGSWLKKP